MGEFSATIFLTQLVRIENTSRVREGKILKARELTYQLQISNIRKRQKMTKVGFEPTTSSVLKREL
jgi:hypothetical protein